MYLEDNKFTDKCPWYSTTICTTLKFKSSKIILKQDRYYLMSCVDAYEKEHVPMPSDLSSGGVKPMPSMSSKKNFTRLVTQSTFLTIGFNYLMTIIRI